MIKTILQIIAAIATFALSFFSSMPKKRLRFYLIAVCLILIVNCIYIYFDDKNSDKEKKNLNQKIDSLIAMNDQQRKSIDNLESTVAQNNEKIDGLHRDIARLVKLLEGVSVASLEKTDNYAEAKKAYDSAIRFMNQGNQKEAAQKFLEFRQIAIKENAFQAAAISSLLAAYRFEEAGEEARAAQLHSEAGDFYIKLNDPREARIWKRKAKELYEQQGLCFRCDEARWGNKNARIEN